PERQLCAMGAQRRRYGETTLGNQVAIPGMKKIKVSITSPKTTYGKAARITSSIVISGVQQDREAQSRRRRRRSARGRLGCGRAGLAVGASRAAILRGGPKRGRTSG